MYRKVVLLILIFVGLGLGIYFSYFRRPPIADILAANKALVRDEEYYVNEEIEDEYKLSQRKWDAWVRSMNFVSIGKIYDACNESKRLSVGRVVMLQDEVNGGVTSKTFINVTLSKDLTGGLLYISCKYNGNTLYINHWDLCTMEEGNPDRVIFCPIRRGKKKLVKQLKIPNYLPKGLYTTKVRMVDQDGRDIGCGYAEFSL